MDVNLLLSNAADPSLDVTVSPKFLQEGLALFETDDDGELHVAYLSEVCRWILVRVGAARPSRNSRTRTPGLEHLSEQASGMQ